MMYEELLKLLKDKAGRFNYDGWVDTAVILEDAADAIEDQANLIDAQLSIIKQLHAYLDKYRWIPVTERLPEDKEMVLCFTPADGYMFVGFHFSYKWGSNTVSKWRIITAMRSTKDITKKVTHWMPLPEPPKEEA